MVLGIAWLIVLSGMHSSCDAACDRLSRSRAIQQDISGSFETTNSWRMRALNSALYPMSSVLIPRPPDWSLAAPGSVCIYVRVLLARMLWCSDWLSPHYHSLAVQSWLLLALRSLRDRLWSVLSMMVSTARHSSTLSHGVSPYHCCRRTRITVAACA